MDEKSGEKTAILEEKGLIEQVFSWSLRDVLDRNLYKNKVRLFSMSFFQDKYAIICYSYVRAGEKNSRDVHFYKGLPEFIRCSTS